MADNQGVILALVSLFVLSLSAYLFGKVSGSLSFRRLNMVSWVFYFSLLLQSFFGVNLLVAGQGHYLVAKSGSQEVYLAYGTICYTIVMMPLAMYMTQFFFGKVQPKIEAYYTQPLVPAQTHRDSGLILFWGAMSIITVMSTAYVFVMAGGDHPFLMVMRGDTDAGAHFRAMLARHFPGNEYVKNIFSRFLSLVTVLVVYGYYFMTKKRMFLIWFVILFLHAVFVQTLTGEKAPLLTLILALFFCRSYYVGYVAIKGLVAFFVFVLVYAAWYYLQGGGLQVALNSGPIGRIILTSIAALPLTFYVFPEQHDFLSGASFPEWMTHLLGLEHARSSRILMEMFHADAVGAGTAGVINTLYVAEAYANFGWYGLVFAPIFVGIEIQLLYNLMLYLPKTPLFVAVMSYLTVALPVMGGFIDFIWNPILMFLAVLIVAGLVLRSVVTGNPRLLTRWNT